MEKTWKVTEKHSPKGGTYLEFRRGVGTYELSPTPYFHQEDLKKRVLSLNSGDIGYRQACLELCRRYGDDWNI